MIYTNWMSYIKDEALITKIAIPGAHNAGSYGMVKMGCCQNDNMFKQFQYGCRHFCIRLNTDIFGNIRLSHGLSFGDLFENCLIDLKKMIDENDSEIFIFDIRVYYEQKIGPVTFKYKVDTEKVNSLLKKYINPEIFAYTDFEDINTVTLGDIRKSGKRYIFVNDVEMFEKSRNVSFSLPWDKKIFGETISKFIKGNLKFFDNEYDGLFCFQTQQTPNFGTHNGLKNPTVLESFLYPRFNEFIDAVKSNPGYVEKANIFGCDFITDSYKKSRGILSINLDKKIVKDELIDEYTKVL